MMHAIDRLIESDRSHPLRIAVIGDGMIDAWHVGWTSPCQEGCPRLENPSTHLSPGGAANAARQLWNWHSKAMLISPGENTARWEAECRLGQVETRLCLSKGDVPIKSRWLDLDTNKVVFRSDYEQHVYGLDDGELRLARHQALNHLKRNHFDGVLISDYDKGFLDGEMIREIIQHCAEQEIPVVADAKRSPFVYQGAILKGNLAYAQRYGGVLSHSPAAVITCGSAPPLVLSENGLEDLPAVCGTGFPCVNHVGAGDCFAAYLILALAHGLCLEDAAAVADAAGNVYVRNLFGVAPWPFQVRRQMLGAAGKVAGFADLAGLRASTKGRIVFSNGVFRVPHAGHAWLLGWARQQGDVLVAGINDDTSAQRLRPGQFVLPLAERLEVLAGLECVDWIVPFPEADPRAIMEVLKPDLLVKGDEYRRKDIPGSDLCPVAFAPPGPYSQRHASTLFKDGTRPP